MKVTGETIIYRKEFNEKPAYSRRISSKKYENGKQLDEWIGTYESVQLPRGTELADKTKVNIKDSFESVFEKRDGTIMRKLVITKFDVVGSREEEDVNQDVNFQAIDENVPF